MPKVNFEILVADFDDQYFALTVIDAPKRGPDLGPKSFPIDKLALNALIQDVSPDLAQAVISKDDALRAHGSPADISLRKFGRALFDLVIWPQQGALTESWGDFAERREPARRLRLCLTNKAAALPWEALRDDHKLNGCPARLFSVVRHIPTSWPLQPLVMGAEPLRILVVFADPHGGSSDGLPEETALQKERTAIQAALQSAESRKDLCIDFVGPGAGRTLDLIKAKVAEHKYHVLHFFGHGHNTGQGQLEFEGVRGESELVGWGQLQRVLEPTLRSLRLVVLNACELAQLDEELVTYSPFSNLAGSFLNAGAAMVIAMQFPIRTATATRFTDAFYKYLGPRLFASAEDVEDAVVQGRGAIENEPNAVEWITPVVFTRVQDDTIFRFGSLREARALYDQGLWIDAALKVKEGLMQGPKSEEGLRLERDLLDRASFMIERLDPTGGEIVDALHRPTSITERGHPNGQ